MSQSRTLATALQQGRELIRSKKYAEAIELLQKLLESDPKEEDVLEMLGMAFFFSKQYTSARDTFERLTKANPMHLNGWVNLGAILNRLGEHKKAIDALRRAVQRDRRCAEGFYNMGIAQRALNLNTMAISAYKEAIKLKPDLIEAHLNLGNIYADMKNMGLALQCFLNALKQDPNSAKAKASLEKVQLTQKAARREASPFGRLVDVRELDKQLRATGPRTLEPAPRNEERELVQTVTKQIRHSAKELVPILTESLQAQLHRLQRDVLQSEARLASGEHIEFFSQTISDLQRLKTIVAEGLGEIREHLASSE